MLETAAMPPLAASLTSGGDLFSRFLEYATAGGLELYPAQEEAILELFQGRHLVLETPTGSGKSLVALAAIFRALGEGGRAFYTCPIKALVNEKFFWLCRELGPERVGMITGDGVVNRDAPVICCTAEILMNLALRDADARVDLAVMDEFHYYGDRDRGVAWQIPLITLTRTQFLLMSATLGDTSAIEKSLQERTGREVAAVRSSQRPVPLEFEWRETPLHETIAELVEKDRWPIYLVNFTQRAAAEEAQNLMSVNFSSKEQKEKLREALDGVRFDSPYGKDFQRYLRHGIGIHHAGLLPRYRLLVEKLAQAGLLKVVSGTDTLGVGVNVPIRTVLFTRLFKYDGEKLATLTVRDFKQIAGRAGRKGFDTKGYVVAQAPEHVIENVRLAQKAAAGKKVQKKSPPQKGYVHYDRATFQRLIERPPEPLVSRFAVTHGMIVSLLQSGSVRRGGGYGRLVELIRASNEGPGGKRRALREAKARFRSLLHAGIVEVYGIEGYRGRMARVAEGLQPDFSLTHTLSLWLLETLPRLDRESETYALDVLTLVESILESPDVILWKQVDRLKGEKVAELKAAGVEYEERMAELEKVEHPKPLADLVYSTFNDFADRHPWVGQENIRPKSIAREMVETGSTFADYVRSYDLQRSEGVLLRYLSDAYRTLAQGVPEALRTDELLDVLATLRDLCRRTDSSLVDEWESMQGRESAVASPVAVPVHDLARDRRALAARVRAEVHRLARALATGLLEDVPEWPADRLAADRDAYLAAAGSIDATPRSRRAHLTTLEEEEPRLFRVRHSLLDAEGEIAGWLEGAVDLRQPRSDDAPLFTLERIAAA